MAEAQRGTITHNVQGASLTGERQTGYPKGFDFLIDGNEYANTFRHAEWTFTPDKPALPTEPGFYRLESDLGWNGAYHLNIRGGWNYINGSNGHSSPLAADLIPTRLIRLIPETEGA